MSKMNANGSRAKLMNSLDRLRLRFLAVAPDTEASKRRGGDFRDELVIEFAMHELDRLAEALEAEKRRVRELEGIVDGLTPRPIKDHPNYFEDGDTYLLMVPVIDRFERRHYEHHIVSVSCDSETPVTFKDQNSDSWDAWEWDDAEFYIRNPKYPDPKPALAAHPKEHTDA